MTTLTTRFRGDVSIREETIDDGNIALNAGIKLSKLEKTVIAADGSSAFTGNQSFGGFKIINLGNPSLPDDAATKSYVDAMITGCEHPIDYVIHYLKDSTGAPSGSAIDHEICLNTEDGEYYKYLSGNWGSPITLINGNRFIFALNGSNTTGTNGIYTKTDKIYEFTGGTVGEYFANYGCVVLIRNSSYNVSSDSGWVYDGDKSKWIQMSGGGASGVSAGDGLERIIDTLNVLVNPDEFNFNGSNEISLKIGGVRASRIKFGTGTDEVSTDNIPEGAAHLFLTDERVDNRVSNLLTQGEGIDLYYDNSGNYLRISCEVATEGSDLASTNRGVASFNNESFDVTNGFVSLETVDGGEWMGPSWVSYFDNTCWVPQSTTVWNSGGQYWDSQGGEILLFVTGSWYNNYYPSKARITFTGESTQNTSIRNFDGTFILGSDASYVSLSELILINSGNLIGRLYMGWGNVHITNIEFLV